MPGCVTDISAKFWLRTANEVSTQVFVSSSQNMGPSIKSAAVKTNKDTDFTAVLTVQGLKPDTKYYYELFLNGRKQPKRWSFSTFPPDGAKAKFQIGFGGGAGYTPQYERMWNTVAAHNLLALSLIHI